MIGFLVETLQLPLSLSEAVITERRAQSTSEKNMTKKIEVDVTGISQKQARMRLELHIALYRQAKDCLRITNRGKFVSTRRAALRALNQRRADLLREMKITTALLGREWVAPRKRKAQNVSRIGVAPCQQEARI